MESEEYPKPPEEGNRLVWIDEPSSIFYNMIQGSNQGN